MANVEEGVLFGLGNPLLDIQARVSKEFLTKWGLNENDAILCDEKLVPIPVVQLVNVPIRWHTCGIGTCAIDNAHNVASEPWEQLTGRFDELVASGKDVEYVPGGATQNSIRVAQWMLKKPKAATYMGCIGNDKFGKILAEKVLEVGVNGVYQIHPTEKTGTCAVCLFGNSRSLCAHLAAANCFTKDHLEIPEHWKLVEKAKCFYIAGFHLTVCPPAIMKIAEHANKENKIFSMNLSAPFISSIFKEPQLAAMPYVDILFGNDDMCGGSVSKEAKSFGEENGLQVKKTTDVRELAQKIATWPKVNQKRQRMVIITQGPGSVVVANGNDVREFTVPVLKQEQIVDTNGAGDAFVAGFLAQIVQGKPLEKAIDSGIWAAHLIIQRSGCTFPPVCEYE